MSLLQLENRHLKILAKVKVTFFAGYIFLRNRLSDRAQTKCILFLAKFHVDLASKILKFHTGRPLSLHKNCAREMQLVSLNWKLRGEFNGLTFSTVRLNLQYESPELLFLTEWVLCKKEQQLTYMSAILPLLTLRLVLTENFLTSVFLKLFLCTFRHILHKISFSDIFSNRLRVTYFDWTFTVRDSGLKGMTS